MNSTVNEMEKANAPRDVKKIYKLVNIISGKPRKPPCNLATDKNGNLLQTSESIAGTWRSFLSKKFETTTEESLRPSLSLLENLSKTAGTSHGLHYYRPPLFERLLCR